MENAGAGQSEAVLWPDPRITPRDLVVAAAAALVFVPLFIVTISTLHVPPPWRVGIGTAWAPLVTWVLGWIVLPFAVGVWRRRWWWPLLCLGVVLVTALNWNGGQVSVGPSAAYVRQSQGADESPPAIRDGRDRSTVVPGSGDEQRIKRRQERQRRQAELAAAEAQRISMEGPATVWVLPHALALGGLAAIMAALGIARADTIRRVDSVDPVVLRRWITAGLVMAIISVVVGWVVIMYGLVQLETPWLRQLSLVAFLAVTLVGSFAAGLWLGQWWWVLACLLVPPTVLWLWGLPYLAALPDLSVVHDVGGFFTLVLGIASSLLAALSATLGVLLGRRSEPVRPSAAAWPSSLWARWLGWTALYGLLYGGAFLGDASLGFFSPLPHLVGLALALLIGLRFRSWSWIVGPPAGIILGFVALIVIAILQSFFFTAVLIARRATTARAKWLCCAHGGPSAGGSWFRWCYEPGQAVWPRRPPGTTDCRAQPRWAARGPESSRS